MSDRSDDFDKTDDGLLPTVDPLDGRTGPLFSPADIYARIEARALATPSPDALDRLVPAPHGDFHLNNWEVDPDFLATSRIAAVLVGLVERDGEINVVLTQRASALRVHSGQIAFPGGKMDPTDPTPADAALREVHEEIGIPADRIDVLGYMPPYLSGSGFRVLPVIARLNPPFEFVCNPDEVDEVFEVPFAFLMSDANHSLLLREWKGRNRKFYAMPYQERQIWGITAGILRMIYERLYL